MIPVVDQQKGAQADEFPKDEDHHQVVGQDHPGHRKHEERQSPEEPRLPLVEEEDPVELRREPQLVGDPERRPAARRLEQRLLEDVGRQDHDIGKHAGSEDTFALVVEGRKRGVAGGCVNRGQKGRGNGFGKRLTQHFEWIRKLGILDLIRVDDLMTPATFNIAGIVFNSDASAYVINPATIGTNGFSLTGDIVNDSVNAQVINSNMTYNSLRTFNPAAGDMTLGVGLLLAPLHNPVYTAETIATLDVIARGRMVFGVGLGYRTAEFEAFGVRKGERVQRFEECLTIAKRLWTEDKVSYASDTCVLKDAHLSLKCVQQPHRPAQIDLDAAHPGHRIAVAELADAASTWLAATWVRAMTEVSSSITPVRPAVQLAAS